MARILRLCNGKDGSGRCLKQLPNKLLSFSRNLSYLPVLQDRWVYTCKPLAGGFEIKGEVGFDAISSTFNNLFDNLIGFM